VWRIVRVVYVDPVGNGKVGDGEETGVGERTRLISAANRAA
jgi:hypothetical protein